MFTRDREAGVDEARERLTDAMNRQRQHLGIKWNEVARRAGMSVQNLLRIRNGEISITDDAARQIERALQWPDGRVDAILAGAKFEQPERPTRQPRTDEANEPFLDEHGNALLDESGEVVTLERIITLLRYFHRVGGVDTSRRALRDMSNRFGLPLVEESDASRTA